MTAAVLRGPGMLDISRVERPQCGPGDALLRVAACGICGSDVRALFDGDRFSHIARIPGHEPAGTIVEAGRDVKDWREGDDVALAADISCGNCFYCQRELFNLCEHHQILGKHLDGGLAEYMLLSERLLSNGIIHRVPEGLPLSCATLAEPISSVLASHDELQVVKGERAVVIGSGAMGILHLIFLRRRGARVALVGRSSRRLGFAKIFAAEAIINSSEADVVESVLEFTEGHGADVVICAAPSPSAIQQTPCLARKRGRIGLFAGLPSAQSCIPLDINRVHYDEQRLIGNFSYHPRYHREALRLLVQGVVDCDAIVTEYPLQLAQQALQDVRNGRVLKAVVTPNDRA